MYLKGLFYMFLKFSLSHKGVFPWSSMIVSRDFPKRSYRRPLVSFFDNFYTHFICTFIQACMFILINVYIFERLRKKLENMPVLFILARYIHLSLMSYLSTASNVLKIWENDFFLRGGAREEVYILF